jgi:hypothetical protein
MKKTISIGGVLLLAFCLMLLFYVFSETGHFLRETVDSVSSKNVRIEICPIFGNEIPKICSSAINQEVALSSLLKARKQLPLSHPVSLRKFFFRIRFITDNKPGIYCLIANQYEGQEKLLFLSNIEPEVSCDEGEFKYQAGSLAIDNFLMDSVSP